MKHQGRISHWNDEKGFGFVAVNKSAERAFVHISAFKEQARRPIDGELIDYELVRDGGDRYLAQQITYVNKSKNTLPPRRVKKRRLASVAKTFILLFCCALGISIFTEHVPFIFLEAYLVMSLVTFIIYAFDKSAAQRGRWRTQENTLHLLSLIGGWPGAYLAQRLLRHKSRKKSFKRIYWLTVLFNISGFAWLHTHSGIRFINQLSLLFQT